MKKWTIWMAAVLAGTAAVGDDLLDEVLRWDKPAARPKAEMRQETPAELPTWEDPAAETESEPQGTESREEELRQRLEAAERRAAIAEEALSRPTAIRDSDLEEEDDGSAAGMEWKTRLALRGGGGGDGAVALSGELSLPLGKSPFDLALRGFYTSVEYSVEKSAKETYYTHYRVTRHRFRTTTTYYRSRKHTRTVYYTDEESTENYGGEALVVWRPFRGKTFSPYFAVGGRFEGAESEDDEGGSLGGRGGLTLNLGPCWLGVEYGGGKAGNEAVGMLGWRCSRHVALNAFVNRFEGKADGEGRNGVALGGGLTLVF